MRQTYEITARHANGSFMGRATMQAANPLDAVYSAARCYTWAQGWSDFEAGYSWPFNPDMTIDGERACDIVAAHWAAAAASRGAGRRAA